MFWANFVKPKMTFCNIGCLHIQSYQTETILEILFWFLLLLGIVQLLILVDKTTVFEHLHEVGVVESESCKITDLLCQLFFYLLFDLPLFLDTSIPKFGFGWVPFELIRCGNSCSLRDNSQHFISKVTFPLVHLRVLGDHRCQLLPLVLVLNQVSASILLTLNLLTIFGTLTKF